MKVCFYYAAISVFLITACSPSKITTETLPDKRTTVKVPPTVPRASTPEVSNDVFIQQLLSRYPQFFDSILKNKDVNNVQIIYTQINRREDQTPILTNHYFNVNKNRYYYPASTVKLPTVALALQRLNELKDKGINKTTTIITEAGYSGQTPVYNDPLTPDGKPNIASYIKRILLVSDNDAFNRLFEFLGPDYINGQLHKMGYPDVQIRHRLSIPLTPDENLHTNPINFFDNNNNLVYAQLMMVNQGKYSPRQDSLGKFVMNNGTLVPGPMDFSKKNRLGLEDLHNILRSLIFPNSVAPKQRFNLSPEDYAFIYKYMSSYPSESIYPMYDTATYYDAYAKFLFYGAQKTPVSKSIRIFNKVGDAYGQLTDVAYITDPSKNVEFFLSATMFCNSKGIINYEDGYEYEKVGYPFFKNLGKVFYDYELTRSRKVKPDLVGFKINYDK